MLSRCWGHAHSWPPGVGMRALCPFLGAGAGHVQKPEGESARDMSGSREGGEAAGIAGCQGLVLDMPNAQCPMPNAQCPMPAAPCPLSYAPCLVPHAESQEWTCSPVAGDMLIPGGQGWA